MQAIDQTNPASLDQQGAGVNIARLGDGADAALGAGGMFGIIEEATTMQVWPPAVPSPAWEPNLPALVELTVLVVRRVDERKGYLISVVLPHGLFQHRRRLRPPLDPQPNRARDFVSTRRRLARPAGTPTFLSSLTRTCRVIH
jgi:hypothetical protein